MSTVYIIIILGDKKEEVKGKEESILPTNYHTWVWPVLIPESPL